MKVKENEKVGKYLHLAKELKKLGNIKKTVIPIVVGAFGIGRKKLKKRFSDLEIR